MADVRTHTSTCLLHHTTPNHIYILVKDTEKNYQERVMHTGQMCTHTWQCVCNIIAPPTSYTIHYNNKQWKKKNTFNILRTRITIIIFTRDGGNHDDEGRFLFNKNIKKICTLSLRDHVDGWYHDRKSGDQHSTACIHIFFCHHHLILYTF